MEMQRLAEVVQIAVRMLIQRARDQFGAAGAPNPTAQDLCV
jgi:hypothetical protein